MPKHPPGWNAEYARLRDAREARRAEVEALLGWSGRPGRAWSKAAARGTAIRRAGRNHSA